MTPAELIARVNSMGGRLYLANGELRVKAPKDGLTPELRSLLADNRAALVRFLEHASPASTANAPPIVSVSRATPLAASFAQERLWFLEQMEPGLATYNMYSALKLKGHLDVAALTTAVQHIVARHEVLRTSITNFDNQPSQVISPQCAVTIEREYVADVNELAVQAWLHKKVQIPFNLDQAPLLRIHMLEPEAGDDHILLIVMHHIISDAWSLSILLYEIASSYTDLIANRPIHLPALTVQYADFSAWQRQRLNGSAVAPLLNFWKSELDQAPSLLTLPSDRTRPARPSYSGAHVRFALSADLLQKLGSLAANSGASIFMLFHAAFAILLGRHAGTDDIVVGTPVAGRTAPELEQSIGLFLNTVVLRVSLAGNPSFIQLLDRVKQRTLAAFEYQEFPFEKLVEVLKPDRDMSHAPIFQVAINYRNSMGGDLRFGNLDVDFVRAERSTAKLDLSLSIDHSQTGALLDFEYATDLFDASTISRLARGYKTLLEAISGHPEQSVSDLPVLATQDISLLLSTENKYKPANPYREFVASAVESSIAGRFESQVALYAERLAVRSKQYCWTYRDLNTAANRIAHRLIAIAPTDDSQPMAGILMKQDAPVLAAILGALKAGWAYVPLDTEAPLARLQQICTDAGILAVVCDADHRRTDIASTGMQVIDFKDMASEPGPATDPKIPVHPDQLAYVLFTSGSTGRPKGVMQTQRNVLHHCRTYTNSLHISCEDRLSLLPPYGFDAAVMDIFGALLNGACIFPYDLRSSDTAFSAEQLRLDEITVLHCTPTVFRYLFSELTSLELPLVRAVVLGGEEARPSDLALFRKRFRRNATLINGLGPTESTVTLQFFAGHETELLDSSLPVGRPVDCTDVVLLDRDGASSGIAGELCIHSPYVTPGYWKAPELTDAAFITLPGYEHRLYRTGDHARRLPDGTLVFLGRRDGQIKLRGHRIEAGEIESLLQQHPSVSMAAVKLWTDDSNRQQLIAYVSSTLGSQADAVTLQSFLEKRLPGYMLPSSFIILDTLPLTASGKIDRLALPEPQWQKTEYQPPINPVEESIALLWSAILGVTNPGRHDNFFSCGGHSLLATQLLSRIQEEFGVRIALRDFFDGPDIAHLAVAIATSGKPALRPLVPADRTHELPASFGQQRLWFIDQFIPGTSIYNLSTAIRIQGQLDRHALAQALDHLEDRHEILRTRFAPSDGAPIQIVADPVGLPLHIIDNPGASPAQISEFVRDLVRKPFTLHRGPLIRVYLATVSEFDSVLIVVMHHIISDAWSMRVFLNELRLLYTALHKQLPGRLPKLPVQYGDFSVWQHACLNEDFGQHQLDYWATQLHGANTLLELPTDRPRPAVMTFNGSHLRWVIPANLCKQIKQLGQSQGATLFMVLLAAFNVLLARYSGQTDILVGTPIAGRTRTELESLIGLFVNMLVIRTRLAENDDFRDLLGQVKTNTLNAFDHQDLPFERIVEAIQPERSTRHSPLFQAAFILQNAPVPQEPFEDLEISSVPFEHNNSKFDLTAAFWETEYGLESVFEYNTDLFDVSTLEQMQRHFLTILESVVRQPDTPVLDLPLLTAPEYDFAINRWNDTAREYPRQRGLDELFTDQAREHPDRTAVSCGELRLSYAELNQRANRIARLLQDRQVRPGTFIAICMDRCPDAIAAALGIIKAGCAYVPLDPAYPAVRLEYILKDTATPLLLSTVATEVSFALADCERLDLDDPALGLEGLSAADPAPCNSGSTLAYAIYTSGSTGLPKGTQIEHQSIMRLVINADYVSLDSSTRMAVLAPMAFDASTFEIWGALLNGGECCLLPDRIPSISALTQFIRSARPDTAFLTTALFNAIVDDSPDILGGFRQLLTGGEQVSVRHMRQAFERLPTTRIIHVYGPTETTTFATAYPLVDKPAAAAATIPIGRAIGNTTTYVLDSRQHPVPVGVHGELYIGGDGLSRGYLNQPELSRERFIELNLADGQRERVYRTGDIVRLLRDGNIEFVGRKDTQIKLRGFRIELGEIESCMRAFPQIDNCTVVVDETDTGDRRLIGYYVADKQADIKADDLRSFLAGRLPAYMVPTFLLPVDVIPLTVNGKIDKAALPKPQATGTSTELPANDTEVRMLDIWRTVLGSSNCGVGDDFFALGGHSLLIIKLLKQVETTFGQKLTIADVFENPTVRGLSTRIVAAPSTHVPQALVPIDLRGEGRPVFLVHFDGLQESTGGDAPARPVYGLDARFAGGTLAAGTSIATLAELYLADLRSVQAAGPYTLAGNAGAGALVALAMADLIEASGEQVDRLILLGDNSGQHQQRAGLPARLLTRLYRRAGRQPPRGLRAQWNALVLADACADCLAADMTQHRPYPITVLVPAAGAGPESILDRLPAAERLTLTEWNEATIMRSLMHSISVPTDSMQPAGARIRAQAG